MKSYVELINEYWDIAQEYRFTSTEGYLYFYLLSVANKYGWKHSFGLSNRQIMANIDTTKATLIKARATLIKANLIAYEASNSKRETSKYSILGYKNYTQCDTQCDTLHKIKTKTSLKKENIKRKKVSLDDLGLKFDEEKKVKKEIPPPSLEEVTAICVEKGMSEEEAKQFYYYYDAQGWVTSTGQKIKRIDSMVNRWLSNGKQKAKDNGGYKDNATKKQERNDEIARDIISRYM